MRKHGLKKKLFAVLLTLCMVFTIMPTHVEAASLGDVQECILYQLNEATDDVRLVAYVDDLDAYSSVSFTLTMGDKVSKALECTTGYVGLYAAGNYYTTEQIYGVDGYFVTYVIKGYITLFAGEEVTITVTYTQLDGETVTDERTVTIGTKEVEMKPVTVTGNLTYANGYDWSDSVTYQNQIYVFASSDATVTPVSMLGQSENFFKWWNGVLFEYDETSGNWKATTVDYVSDGANAIQSTTLGDNRFIVLFHNQSVTGQADSYNFFKEYVSEGELYTLSTDLAALQAAKGALTDVTLSYTYDAPVEDGDDTTNPDEGDDDTTTPGEDESTTPIEVPNGLAVYMPSDGPIKIAQFADLHFGTEGKSYHNNREERTKAYMQYIVDTEKPDLIVCSGDNIMTTGTEGLQEFIDLMESYKIPWTMIYGNHDAESTSDGYSRASLSAYLDACVANGTTEYLLYDSGYVDTDAVTNRYGNFSISVLNEKGTKLLGAIILFDGGTYVSGSGYDSITEGQISWYESEIATLDALYTGEGTIPSMVFSHIQLPEFYDSYKAARGDADAADGVIAEFVINQDMSDSSVTSIKTGGPTSDAGFFDSMKENGSVAFFCGHAHLFDFQVERDGIILGFGPQTGFSTLFADNDMPRKTYIYNFAEDFSFTTTACVEPGEDLGLAYTGTFDSDATYDEETGTYVITKNFNSGNYIMLSYNGVRLTTSNTTISGAFTTATTASYSGKFYSPSGTALYFDGTYTNTCTFTYNPTENTLTIDVEDVEPDPNAPTSVTYTATNTDAGSNGIALWTTAGTELRTVTDTSTGDYYWVGNNWRYYVVVDSEGRIAYAVLWPASGYGGPMTTTYYTHPCYYDYTTNPAISLLDGFANDWSSGGIGYNLFEIVVPEGGFAITGHGTGNYDIVDMLSQGTVEDYGVANINTRSLYNSKIRVTYDTSTQTISIYTVEEDTTESNTLTATTLNSDAGADAIGLWTTAGEKLKYNDETTGEEQWLGNNWRYYVVVDSEGRIAYAVYQPLSGYGGPAGTTYYAHPYYTDYTRNPAINLLDGFATDWGTGTGYTKFEIVVPEGGFAITGHGTANADIVKLLSQGNVETCEASAVNNRNVYDSSIRLSYDEETMTVYVTTVE